MIYLPIVQIKSQRPAVLLTETLTIVSINSFIWLHTQFIIQKHICQAEFDVKYYALQKLNFGLQIYPVFSVLGQHVHC